MATSKKAPKKAAPKKAAPKKAAKAKVQVPDITTLLQKIDLQLGRKKITFSAKDIEQASACLKKTGRIKIMFKDVSIINVTPDGGTPPGPID